MPTIRSTLRTKKHSAPPATMSVLTLRQLIRDVSAGIRVLQTRDGMHLSEDQIKERARNIVTGLMGNYRIEILDDGHARPAAHSPLRTVEDADPLDAPAVSNS